MVAAVACLGFSALSFPVFTPESPAPAPALTAALAQPANDGDDEPLVAALTAYLASKRRTRLHDGETERLARTIVGECRRNGLEVSLVLAVIHVESRYDTYAVSPVGALGLMQVMPATGEELAREAGIRWRGPQTLFDPEVNVRLGTAYLSQLAARYESIPTALAAYNWGPGRIDRRLRLGTPLPQEYPQLVMDAYASRYGRHSYL